MRDIKFRAWDTKANNIAAPYNKEIEGSSVGDYKWSLKTIGVDKDVVLMQYTGLTDKNGVEIYEGDIARDKDGFIYKYEWNVNGHWHTKKVNPVFVSVENYWELEIIGNIYENPELLEEK